jgi:uncharacterized protein with NRDE domain
MGTWLGVNEARLAVAVTNRSDGELAWADQTRSRGLLAVALLGFDRPERAVQFALAELSGGGFGGCNYLIAHPAAAFVVEAPGASRITSRELAPGFHAMTNLDLDDPDDPRIRFVAANLDPRDFLASAKRICRDDRIIIPGVERGTVCSSVLAIDTAIVFEHILGDPRGREYEEFRLLNGPGC